MESKYELEDFVNENLELFNNEEPPEGHFERFKAKLEQKSVSKDKRIVFKPLRYAAAVALVISAFLIWQYSGVFTGGNFASVNEDEEEFTEISNFYNAEINKKYDELNSITCKSGNEQKESVNNDLNELTNSYKDLEEEFIENPENQLIKEAMIENFQTRLNILDMVINTLKTYC